MENTRNFFNILILFICLNCVNYVGGSQKYHHIKKRMDLESCIGSYINLQKNFAHRTLLIWVFIFAQQVVLMCMKIQLSERKNLGQSEQNFWTMPIWVLGKNV